MSVCSWHISIIFFLEGPFHGQNGPSKGKYDADFEPLYCQINLLPWSDPNLWRTCDELLRELTELWEDPNLWESYLLLLTQSRRRSRRKRLNSPGASAIWCSDSL